MCFALLSLLDTLVDNASDSLEDNSTHELKDRSEDGVSDNSRHVWRNGIFDGSEVDKGLLDCYEDGFSDVSIDSTDNGLNYDFNDDTSDRDFDTFNDSTKYCTFNYLNEVLNDGALDSAHDGSPIAFNERTNNFPITKTDDDWDNFANRSSKCASECFDDG